MAKPSLHIVSPSHLARFTEVRNEYGEAVESYFATATSGSKDDAARLPGLREEYILAESAAVAAAPPFDEVTACNSVAAVLGATAPSPARLVARVTGLEAQEVWSIAGRQHPGYNFTFEDGAGRQICTPLVFSTPLVRAADAAFHGGAPVEVVGFIIGLPTRRKRVPAYVPVALRPLASACAAIGATESEIKEAERLIREHCHEMLPWLIQQLRQINGVVSDGLPLEFELAEKAAVLQAVSTGQLHNANPRIHILLIGLPAAGKKLVAAIVKILEPVALPAQASTLTRAGLAAGAQRRRNALVAQAGLLPRAHLGAVAIEDLHGLRPAHRDQVYAVIAQAAEDGQLDLSTAVSQHFTSQTALYFDLNRRSQLKADSRLLEGGPRAMLADIGMPLHLLSRIDVIVELTGDAEDALKCAAAMLTDGEDHE